jgi:bifunctional UDP-N-acetylglucosamine pyrophosphorylase/glucosamine-1-phosphate N-acetyltransferase
MQWGDVMADMVGVILAAGLGTRMKSDLVKVLHPVCGRSMVAYVIDALTQAGAERIVAVVGHQSERVEQCFGERIEYALQSRQLGTGHAVMQTEPLLAGFSGTVIVANGDAPLLQAETLHNLVEYHRQHQLAATVLTAVLENPTGYGRVIRDVAGNVLRIVEHRDATATERAVREINTGMYAFSGEYLFEALAQVGTGNAQGEFYLTDVISILRAKGLNVGAMAVADAREALGINDRVQLAEADRLMRERVLNNLMLSGVTVIDPGATYVESQVKVGSDTVIFPFTYLAGDTQIGEKSTIGPHCFIVDSHLENEVSVRNAELTRCKVGAKTHIGPYVSLETGAVVQPGSTIKGSVCRMGDELPDGQ